MKYSFIVVFSAISIILIVMTFGLNYILLDEWFLRQSYGFIMISLGIFLFLMGILEYITTIFLGKMLYDTHVYKINSLINKYYIVSNEYFLIHGTLNIANIIEKNIEATSAILKDIVQFMVPAALYIIYLMIIIGYYSIHLCILVILWIVISFGFGYYIQIIRNIHNGNLQNAKIELMSYIQDSMDNFIVNKIFSINNREIIKNINKKNENYYKLSFFWGAIFDFTYTMMAFILFIGTIYLGKNLYHKIFLSSNIVLLFWTIKWRITVLSNIYMNLAILKETENTMRILRNYVNPQNFII